MADSAPRAAAFDQGYFDRYYEDPRTRVHGKKEVAALARGVTGMVRWLGGDLRAVLDVGAGAGLFRDWCKAHVRELETYVSVDVSTYACKTYGHIRRDIARWRSRRSFDLVVCQGVLPYLDDAAAARAIENLAAMCRGFLYLEAITRRDYRMVCDREKTDGTVHLRTGAWYRRALGAHFVSMGSGLHYIKSGPLQFYELELPART